MTHKLKTWTGYFGDIFMGKKTFEIRKNDRNYQVGDTLILQEYNPTTKEFSGRELARTISYIIEGGKFGIEEGYVVMSIQ